ncbi:MAG TPA: tail fiber protein [Thermoanaerobaculia bacterium]|jgi:microcystin-dependent protein|nr:tail fiber protein [Thermoanaerobaculia bacterium]
MAQPFIGEIRMFAGNFAPAGWMFCDGQLIPISQNDTMFVLLGTTYGGDGESTFALPNLQSRVPIHMGNGPGGQTFQLAEAAGVEEVTLSVQQIPNHTHTLIGTSNGALQTSPQGNLFAVSGQVEYAVAGFAPEATFNAASISPAGGSQPHTNLQPYICINYIISLFGLFPSQT